MLFSLTNIAPGDAITVSYTKDGYHDDSQPCLCSKCRPHDPPRSTERRPLPPQVLIPQPGKKKRRGGNRARVRRENRELRMLDAPHELGGGSGNDLEDTSTDDSTH